MAISLWKLDSTRIINPERHRVTRSERAAWVQPYEEAVSVSAEMSRAQPAHVNVPASSSGCQFQIDRVRPQEPWLGISVAFMPLVQRLVKQRNPRNPVAIISALGPLWVPIRRQRAEVSISNLNSVSLASPSPAE